MLLKGNFASPFPPRRISPPGNIEFWPNNYGPNNSKNVPNASASVWDFGDDKSLPVDGYGCMRVHNHEAKQTIFALNQWKSGASADIGNSTGQTRDWTFTSMPPSTKSSGYAYWCEPSKRG